MINNLIIDENYIFDGRSKIKKIKIILTSISFLIEEIPKN